MTQPAPGFPIAAPDVATAELPFISVVVPVRNEADHVAHTIERLFAQDYPADRFEVLVADGRSTDETRTIVTALTHRFANLRLLDNPKQWSSAGRNVAARAARGDVVLLVDGHCEIDNVRYFADLADAFEKTGCDCVGRPQPLDVRGASALQRAIAAARSSRLGHHPDSHIYSDRDGFVPPQSVAVAYRRVVFEKIGYFDESFDACEDVEFNHRAACAGLTCFFTPRVAVKYVPRDSLGRLFRQMIRYGRGRVRLLRKHRDTFTLPAFVPAAFLTGVVLGPLLASLLPLLWFVYGGVLALYLALVFGFSAALATRQRSAALMPRLAAVFVTVHAGAGVGQWWEIVAGAPAGRERPASTNKPGEPGCQIG
jgi:succinoglycan biosynthesis protein ExoA